MKARGGSLMAFSGVVLLVLVASYVSPNLRDKLFALCRDMFDVVLQLRDFVLDVFRST